MIKVDLQGAQEFFDAAGPDYAAAAEAHRLLESRSGAGSEFTGWLELPQRIADGELKAILSAAQKIRRQGEVLLVVGIGGSYLGARAAIELLHTPEREGAEVLFLGNTLPRRRSRADRPPRRPGFLRKRHLQIRRYAGAGARLPLRPRASGTEIR